MRRSASHAPTAGLVARWITAIAAILGFIAACQETSVTAVDVMRVEVTPASASIAIGEMRQLTATLTDAEGHELRGRDVEWSSDDSGIATVDEEGRVRGVATGATTITATAEGRSGEASIDVTGASVETVEVSPPAANVAIGESIQLQATARDGSGAVITGRPVSWSSDNAAVVSVDGNGRATGVTAGATRIVATVDGRTGATNISVGLDPVAAVEVLPALHSLMVGQSVQYQVVLRSSSGAVLSGRTVAWSTTDPNIATIDGSGRATGVAIGSVRVRATAEGSSGEAELAVTAAAVATVEVTPPSSSVTIGGTVQLTATAKAQDGSTVPGRTFVWASDNTNVASVNAQGLVTGHALGDVTITATADGRSGSARVFIADQPVSTVEIQPASRDLVVGDTLTLAAIAKAVDGSVLLNRAFGWTSSDNAIATITPSGTTATAKLQAIAPGTITITATAEGRSGTATFNIAPKPVANVAVVPSSANVVIDGTVQLQAVLTAADNTNLTGRVVAWSSNAPGIATVDGNGLVRGVSVGIATITATSEGKSGTSTITVGLKAVDVVRVQPALDTLVVDETVQLAVTLIAADGSTLTGRAVGWASNSAAVARVDAAGVVTAVAPGTATITATSEGKSGNATIVVIPKPVATVTVEPPRDTLVEGETLQLGAVLRAADNTVLTGRLVTWSSSNTAVADVDNTGKVTAKTPGSSTITATSEGRSGTSQITVIRVPVASVEVQPASATVLHPGTQQFQAITKAANGAVLTGRTITWSSRNPGIATISGTGPSSTASTVNPTCSGPSCTATIQAVSEGVTGTATLTVLKPIAVIRLAPQTLTLTVGGASATINATVEAADGTPLTGRRLDWASSSGNVTVQPSGGAQQSATVRAVNAQCAQGATCTVTVSASAEGKTGTATITIPKPVGSVVVTPASLTLDENETAKVTAVVRAADNSVLTDRAITWSSGNTNIADVTGTGQYRLEANIQAKRCPQGAGNCNVTITATVEGRTDQVSVRVEKRVAKVEVTPAAVTVAEGSTRAVKAVLTASDNTVLTDRAVTWSSGNTAIASVAGTGQFALDATVTGVAIGTTTIRATAEGIDGTADVTVIERVASVTISPADVRLPEGGSAQLHAEVRGSTGAVLADRTVTWTSTNANIATATGTGQYLQDANLSALACPQGSATCTATIRATADGVTGMMQVTVEKQPASVSISPDPVPALLPGATAQLSASVRASDNTDVSSLHPVTWSSSDPLIATVSPSGGLVTAVSSACAVGRPTCDVTITATAGALTDAVTVSVGKPVQAVIITPDPVPEMTAGQTTQLAAKVLASDGTDLSGTRSVVWASDDVAVARVSGSGLVTAVGTPCPQGELTCRARISAVVDGVSAHVDVFVAKVVDHVDVAVANGGTVSVAGILGPKSIEATAFAYAADGTLLGNRTVTWSAQPSGAIPGSVNLSATTGNPITVTGATVGTVTLTATVDGKAGTSLVTVIL
jgi:uncharacterized protein YjdB